MKTSTLNTIKMATVFTILLLAEFFADMVNWMVINF